MQTQKIAPAAAKPRTTQQKIDATEAAVGSVQDAVALLKGDHRKVEALFEHDPSPADFPPSIASL